MFLRAASFKTLRCPPPLPPPLTAHSLSPPSGIKSSGRNKLSSFNVLKSRHKQNPKAASGLSLRIKCTPTAEWREYFFPPVDWVVTSQGCLFYPELLRVPLIWDRMSFTTPQSHILLLQPYYCARAQAPFDSIGSKARRGEEGRGSSTNNNCVAVAAVPFCKTFLTVGSFHCLVLSNSH